MSEATQERTSGFRARGTTWMLGGSIIGAITAYLFQVLIGNALGEVEFAATSIQWTVLFLVLTIAFVPLEQWATRQAARGRDAIRGGTKVALAVGIGAAIVVGIALVALRDTFFGGRLVFAVHIALSLVLYAFMFTAKGQVAGLRRFGSVGTILAVEGSARLAVALVLVSIDDSAALVGWSFIAGPLAFLVVGRRATSAAQAASRVTEPAGRFLGSYVLASGASQVLLGGAPVVVGLLGAPNAVVSVVFVTFTLYRAPLTLLYAVQGRLLSAFLRSVDTGAQRSLRSFGAVLGALGLVLIALGWWVGVKVGPAVVQLLYDDGFTPGAAVAGLVAGGVVAATFAQIGGQVIIAQGRPMRLGAAWASGLAVAAVMVAAGPGDTPELSVSWAFFIGEIAAFCVVTLLVLVSNRPGGRWSLSPPSDQALGASPSTM